MLAFAYPATFEPDEDGRPVVSFPDFPRAHTDGKDDRRLSRKPSTCLAA